MVLPSWHRLQAVNFWPGRCLTSFIAYCKRERMIDALIQHFAPSLLPAPAPTAVAPAQQAPVTASCYEALDDSMDIVKGRCRSLQTAMLALRMTEALLTADPVTPCSVKLNLSTLIKMMENAEELQMNTTSFTCKHVIVLEGLKGAGKTTVARKLTKSASSVIYLDPKATDMHKLMQSIILSVGERVPYLALLCHQLINYHLAAHILTSTGTDFVLEEYHHAFIAQQLAGKLTPEEAQGMAPRVFAWPLDLPMPELVHPLPHRLCCR